MAAVPALAATHTDRLTTTVINPPAGGQTLGRTDSLRSDGELNEKKSGAHIENNDERHIITDEEGVVDRFGGQLQISPEEAALRKKLDRRILVILWAMYFLNLSVAANYCFVSLAHTPVDRAAIAQARLGGLEADLGLVGNEFNVLVSILFVGYTVFQVPSNMLMSTKKIRPSLWMCGWMMAWAVVSACSALARNYVQMLVLRFILGCVEAPFFPGAIYMLSLFYTRREIATRISLLYSANIIAIASSGLISAAIFATLEGKHGIRGWQWLFIIEGVVTFAVAFGAIFMLPDHPLHTRWLSQEERELAQDRMDRDTVGIEPSKGAIAGLKQALVDPKLWVLVVTQTAHLASCGFNSFFPTVVRALGYSNILTLVLTCPPYVVAGLAAVSFAWSSGRTNERTWHITGGMVIAIVGFAISAITLNVGARYTSCFLFCVGAYAANSIILGWVSATCGQTQEKKAASLSIVNMIANASFIYTPYLYPSSDGPKYVMAMSANAAFSFVTLAGAWVLRFMLQRENKKIKAQNIEGKLLYAY